MQKPSTDTTTETRTRPATMRKRIGTTTYEVAVHFSATSKETVNDKIARLIRNEAANRKATDE